MPDSSPTPAGAPETPAAAPKRARGCFLRSGLGCLAVGVGALGTLLFLLPTAITPWAKGRLEAQFAADYEGTLRVGATRLAWFSESRIEGIELNDPSGARVLRADVDAPSLSSLLRGLSTDLGTIRIQAEAALSADDEGVSNLERALRSRHPEEVPEEDREAGGGLASLPHVRVELRVKRLSWSDATTRASGSDFVLRDLDGHLDLAGLDRVSLALNGVIEDSENGRLELEASTARGPAEGDGPGPLSFEVDAHVVGVPTALVDALARQGGALTALLGPELAFDAEGRGTDAAGALSASFVSEHARVDAAGEVRDGVFLARTGTPALAVSLQRPAALGALLAPWLPEGTTLEQSSGGPLDLTVRELQLPFALLFPTEPAGAGAPRAAGDALRVGGGGSFGDWRIVRAAAPGDAAAAACALQLRDVRLALETRPGDSGTLVREARLDADVGGGGALRVGAATLGAASALGDPGERPWPKLQLVLSVEGVPTATLEPWLGAAPAAAAGSEAQPPAPSALARLGEPARFLATVMLDATPDAASGALDRVGLVARVSAGRARGAAPAAPSALGGGAWVLDATVDGALRRIAGGGWAVAEAAPPVVDLALAPTFVSERLAGAPPEPGAAVTTIEPARAADGAVHVRAQAEALTWAGGDEPWTDRLATALTVELGQWTVLADGGGARFEDVGLRVTVGETARSASARLTALAEPAGTAAAGASSPVTAELRIADLALALESEGLPPFAAQLDVEELAALLPLVPGAARSAVQEILGTTLTLAASHEPARNGSSRLGFELHATALDVDVAGDLRDEVFTTSDGRAVVEVEMNNAVLDALLSASLPAGATLRPTRGVGAVVLELEQLVAPLAAFTTASEAAPPGGALAAFVRELDTTAVVRLPDLTYTHPPQAPGAAGVPVAMSGLRLDARLTAGGPASGSFVGSIGATGGGAGAGAIDLTFGVPDPGGFLAEPPPEPPPNARFDGTVSQLPTALLDALLAQDGLLVDVLGPDLRGEVHGMWPAGAEPLRASLVSASGNLNVVGRAEEGVLVSSSDGELQAAIGLTPLFSKRVVGNLVPLLVQVSKPAQGEPVGVSMSDFALPLDGDLTKLSGTLTLDLGSISYRFLPGLEEVLKATGVATDVRTKLLPPMTMRIDGGVVNYQGLPLSIGGQEYTFVGSFDIARQAIDLKTDLPLSVLGSKLTGEVAQFLKPDTLIPLRLSGSLGKPKISLADGFVQQVLKDNAGGLLKGLGGLLDRKKDGE